MFWSWLLILTGCLERDMAEREPAPGVARQLWQWHSCCGSCNQETWSHWNWYHGKLTFLLLTQWLDNSNMCSKYSVECWSPKATSFCKESGIWHLEACCLWRGACVRTKCQYLFVAGTTAKSLLTRGVCLQNVPTYKRCSPMKGAH